MPITVTHASFLANLTSLTSSLPQKGSQRCQTWSHNSVPFISQGATGTHANIWPSMLVKSPASLTAFCEDPVSFCWGKHFGCTAAELYLRKMWPSLPFSSWLQKPGPAPLLMPSGALDTLRTSHIIHSFICFPHPWGKECKNVKKKNTKTSRARSPYSPLHQPIGAYPGSLSLLLGRHSRSKHSNCHQDSVVVSFLKGISSPVPSWCEELTEISRPLRSWKWHQTQSNPCWKRKFHSSQGWIQRRFQRSGGEPQTWQARIHCKEMKEKAWELREALT